LRVYKLNDKYLIFPVNALVMTKNQTNKFDVDESKINDILKKHFGMQDSELIDT
jgi:hypothetical protein